MYQKVEFRCNSRVHAIKRESLNGRIFLEIRCKEKWCTGRRTGVVIIHRFDIETGNLIETKEYKDPIIGRISPSYQNSKKGDG